MKQALKRIVTMLLALTLVIASLPVIALADGIKQVGGEVKALNDGDTSASVNAPDYLELSDGYIDVKVSTKNGGFYVGTEEGDVISKTDNNKHLVYSNDEFDTSFTSFRVTRGGKAQDYIFGRDYSYMGVATSEVSVYKSADNAIVAEWTVDGILFKQTIALMGTDSYQHGMAYVTYSAITTSGDPADSIEARVMMDTALGTVDYAIYMLAQNDGSYVSVEHERTVSSNDYSNYFFAYDSKTNPTVTSYTLNASIEGKPLAPKKVTFAHWANLASSIFDYTPSTKDPLNFTQVYGGIDYLTADSAVALYYDMVKTEADENTSMVSLYYGVYSNYNAGDSDVALNFTSSGTMFFNEDETAYRDLNGSLPGNYSTTIKLQNITDSTIGKLAVAFYFEESIIPHDGKSFVTDFSVSDPFYRVIDDLKAGEARDVRFDFQLDPTVATSYRRIKIAVHNVTGQETVSISDSNLVVEDEMFILCPGAQSAEVGFSGMTPSSVFMKGKRFAYITGSNFALIRDTSQYVIRLRPADGGEDVVLDMDKVVINPELNTATLVLDMELRPTTYEIILDWNDISIDDMKSDALRLVVTDVPNPGDPGYVSSGVYGVITIERNGKSYDIINYPTEEDFKNTSTQQKDIMLVMRGDFNVLSSEEKGRFSAEAITIMDGEIININECLDVKNGRVTVTKNFDQNGKQTSIDVDIDGKVYTTKANTKVWDGVIAISSFKEGNLYTLPVYSEQGLIGYTKGEEDGEEIKLIWPGAASVAQTLAGLLLNLNYGQFALMKQGNSVARVISFGASLDSSFLVPPGLAGTEAHYSNLEKKQLEMGVSAYTAEQLRATDIQYAKDQAAWRDKQRGTLNLYMDDILFGSGGFIGFNTTIEVGIPSYADPLPYIQGTLELKVINDYWEFGVSGSADMMVFEMEATLRLKSYDGFPFPDEIYFFIGGVEPGIPVDPFGVFWIKGAGAGISDIYKTFFGGSTIPPLTLLISGEFALFSQISARADLSISARGLSGYINDMSIAGITIIDRVGGSVYWYPDLSISFAIRVDILDCLIGEGGIVLKETDDGIYFCGYANAQVKIPDKIWLIGGKRIGSASVGISTEKVWASVKIIGIGVGIKYYWGGHVDIDVGKTYDVPEPKSRIMARSAVPIYTDANTGETLFLSVTNDIMLLSGETLGVEQTVVTTSEDKTTHSFTLDSSLDEDALVVLTYRADNALMAEDYKYRVKVSVLAADGSSENYGLEWYDDSYPADHSANSGTNAMFKYDEVTGLATVSISITDMNYYGREITVSTATASQIELYGIARIASLDSVVMNEEMTEVTVNGEGIDKLSKLGIYAADSIGALYPLAELENREFDYSSVTVAVTIPQNLPTGSYTLKAIGTMKDENGNEIANPVVNAEFDYVNAAQPTAPSGAVISLGGNYTVKLEVTSADAEIDGYLTSIYELVDGEYAETIFVDNNTALVEGEGALLKTISLGGRFTSVDDNGDTTVRGLDPGKKYAVSVQSYKVMEDGSRLLSEATLSNELMMVMPTVITPTLSIDGATPVQLGETKVTVDTVNRSTLTVKVTGTEALKADSGYYSLNNGEKLPWNGGDINLKDIDDGTYTLTVEGMSTTMDSFNKKYQFTVDTTAPAIFLASPGTDGFFSGNSTTVSGMTEANSKLEIYVEGSLAAVLHSDGKGNFSGEVALDESLAYQELKIYSTDAAGNVSMPFGSTLTNEILGESNLRAVVLYKGAEVNALVAGAEAKQLSFAFKSGTKYVTMNEGSAAASRIKWSVDVIAKTAQVSKTGELTGDSGAEGIVTATLDNRTAIVQLITVDLANADLSLDIPEGGFVYDGTEHEPAVTIDSDDTVVDGEDYTVSYINNINAGVATAVIVATADGKCVGTRIVNYTIARRSFDDLDISISDSGDENPKVTLKYGDVTLERDKDYTVNYTVSDDGENVIVTVEGIGNYEGFVSKTCKIKNFDHLTWIIPTVTVVILGAAFLVLYILKRRKQGLPLFGKFRKTPAPKADEDSLPKMEESSDSADDGDTNE